MSVFFCGQKACGKAVAQAPLLRPGADSKGNFPASLLLIGVDLKTKCVHAKDENTDEHQRLDEDGFFVDAVGEYPVAEVINVYAVAVGFFHGAKYGFRKK